MGLGDLPSLTPAAHPDVGQFASPSASPHAVFGIGHDMAMDMHDEFAISEKRLRLRR